MATPDKSAKARAEAVFKQPASSEAQHVRDPEAEKIAKLRAQRLAKEHSDRIAAEVRRARREQRRP
ncbi:hypothetical protein P7D22_18300 [Lichenihabitans sp. Uapishka_5]|uniref:hypothetical protein n=1 Tax=Lichenihabitans sp. Uapishka_5 TaxID=3037302 RepID=UPI0029E814A9|nr:hypothetical protein [Lichenihabitans sp. Uapishka_5]MDX7953118.1 hypothetical protein [Lichenihabitans sp. Uapishka_5]